MADKYTPQQLDNIMQLAEEGKLKEIIEVVKQSLIRNNLLVVALEDENAVPKVFYKGEEVNQKRSIGFEWSTETAVVMGSMDLDIEYVDTAGGKPIIKRTGVSKT